MAVVRSGVSPADMPLSITSHIRPTGPDPPLHRPRAARGYGEGMADRSDPRDPAYDWLYGGQAGQPPADDPDATAPMPHPPARESPPQQGAGSSAAGGTGSPADDRTRVFGSPEAGPQPPQQPSFGGTFPAPPAPSDSSQTARFATPVRNGDARRRPPAAGGTPGAPARHNPPAGRPRRRRRWWLRGVLGLLVLWLVFLVAVPIWAWSSIRKVDAEPDGDRPPDTDGTTYLLVGSDSRAELSKQQRGDLGTGKAAGSRTDTILLLHVPGGGGPNLLLSLPRDSYVEIPGRGKNKINAAYSIGGPDLLVQTVEQATDLRVDNYVEIGFVGFVDVVDAVDGITVCPETAVNDPKAGQLRLRKGCQEVDGRTALGYSRSRAFPRGDITRTRHQREVIASVGQKAASWQSVVLPWRYWSLNRAGAEAVRTGEDTGPVDLARFAWAMAHSGGKDAKRCVVPFRSLSASTEVGSVVLWDEQAATELFASVREDDTAGIRCAAGRPR